MKSEQNTLIYIDEKDKNYAKSFAKSFADKNVRNRAFINVLGAELAGKYLASEGIAVSPADNLHNIRKIVEEVDISDVILPGTHIDVRVVFDSDYIFIPKSHFELKIQPHIYFIFELAKDITHVKFLGFIEASSINQELQNNDYYFAEKNKLIPVDKLKTYLDTAKTSTRTELSEAELQNFEESIIDLIDNDIDPLEKKILLKVLTKNQELRNKFIEFENFELIYYRSANEMEIYKAPTPEEKINEDFPPDEFEIFEKDDENIQNLSQTEDVISPEMYNDIIGEDFINNPEEEQKD